MSATLSIRLEARTKQRLDSLALRLRRSKSFLAAEAIEAYVDAEEWQLGEIEEGLAELDSGTAVSHEKVARWLRTWGTKSKAQAPK